MLLIGVDLMAGDQSNVPGNRPPLPSGKSTQTELKARGANRSTKVAGKLQVLPDQPDAPTQSKVLVEPPKADVPVAVEGEPKSPTTPGSDEEEGDEEEEDLEEEQDAEVHCFLALALHCTFTLISTTLSGI